MTANIRVGLAAGECVTPARTQESRLISWRPAAIAAGLVVLLAGAWWLNIPRTDTETIGRALRDMATGGRGSVAQTTRRRAWSGGGSFFRGSRAGRKRRADGDRSGRIGAGDVLGEHARLGQRALRGPGHGASNHYGGICSVRSFRDRSRAGSAVSPARAALNHKIDFPKDSPVSLLSADFGNSNATARGGANLIDVNAALSLRNSSQKRIRSMTLMVSAQDAAGKGIGLGADAGRGPRRNVLRSASSTRLVRPLTAGNPVVEVTLDGVLFDDLSFYGPDMLHSQRTMTVWELEAQRDRKYFKTLLRHGRRGRARKEMLSSLARQADRSQRGRADGARTRHQHRRGARSSVRFPGYPGISGGGFQRTWRGSAASLAGAPQFEVRNRSNRAVQHLEIGWIVKDQQGREFLAASMPADMKLAPNQSGQVAQDAALRFDRPISIQSMSGFVSSVEFADGSQWIPSRGALDQTRLRQVVAPSPEEQRLSQIYTKKGLQALIDELKKF